MANEHTTIAIKKSKDLIEIDAHYYSDFTATADADLDALTDFLQAYMYAQEDKRPDVTLSLALDDSILLKNIKLNENNIFECTQSIKDNAVTLVAELGISAIKHARYELVEVDEEGSILTLLQKKCEKLQSLSNLILTEHGIEIPSEQMDTNLEVPNGIMEIQ